MAEDRAYPYPSGDAEVSWVSTGWLASHLEDPLLQIIDCQPDLHDYIRGHVPGALYVEESHFRMSRDRPGAFIPFEVAELLHRRLGLQADRPVVVCSGTGHRGARPGCAGDGLGQAMLAYTLARYGHRRVHILDGGVDRWQEEGRPLSQAFPRVAESEYRVQLRKDFFLEYGDLLKMKDRPGVLLLDARPEAAYGGQGPWPRPGHIPGAVNLPWESLMDEGNRMLLAPEDRIRAILAGKGITPEKTIICSCGTVRKATFVFCLLRFGLRFPEVRIYEGGFTEWTMYPDNPTVTGKEPF